MEMTLDTQNINCPVLRISGTVLLKDVDDFDATLESIVTVPDVDKLLIDLSQMQNWDDGAIASLLGFIKDWQKEDKAVAIFGLSEPLVAELERKGMAMFFPLFKTEQEALAAI